MSALRFLSFCSFFCSASSFAAAEVCFISLFATVGVGEPTGKADSFFFDVATMRFFGRAAPAAGAVAATEAAVLTSTCVFFDGSDEAAAAGACAVFLTKEIIFFLGGGDLAEDGGADRFSGCFGLDVSAEGASVSFFETTTSSLDWAFFLATSNFFLGGTVVVSVAPAAAFFFGGFALRFFPFFLPALVVAAADASSSDCLTFCKTAFLVGADFAGSFTAASAVGATATGAGSSGFDSDLGCEVSGLAVAATGTATDLSECADSALGGSPSFFESSAGFRSGLASASSESIAAAWTGFSSIFGGSVLSSLVRSIALSSLDAGGGLLSDEVEDAMIVAVDAVTVDAAARLSEVATLAFSSPISFWSDCSDAFALDASFFASRSAAFILFIISLKLLSLELSAPTSAVFSFSVASTFLVAAWASVTFLLAT
mmetsp:Transcript_11644/g.26606  ORF Transcript_11644/g.26606 Transcript_11644/m.26606 type:complete len:429 (+) Transcript_11644:1121-2407(+)